MSTTTLPVFVWPLHDPITKSFIDTIQSFLLEIHQALDSIRSFPQLKQQTFLLSQQFQALLETFIHQLKITYAQYVEDYPLLLEDKDRFERLQRALVSPIPLLPPTLDSSSRYICRQSQVLFNNLILPRDLFCYIQSLESIKSILSLFFICHFNPSDNLTAQFLSWMHQSNPVPIEYYQYLASVDQSHVDHVPLPFNKGIHSPSYWHVCSKLLAQGRVVELFQLLDINSQLDHTSGVEDHSWRSLLTSAILLCPSLQNVLTEYTSIQYNVPTDSCCLLGALDMCTDFNHKNPGIKIPVKKPTTLSKSAKPGKASAQSAAKLRKFGITADIEAEDNPTPLQPPPQFTAWEYLPLEQRFQSWQTQINQIIRIASHRSPQFTQNPAFKLLQVLIDLDSTINELFFHQIYAELEPVNQKYLQKNGAPKFDLVWLDITLYMLLYRFPSASNLGFMHIIQESYDSCLQFIELQIENKKCSPLQLQVYTHSLENDEFSDAVRSIATHNILHSLFMLESLITLSSKQIVKTLMFNYSSHNGMSDMGDNTDHLGRIDLDTNRTQNDEFISIFGFDWILAIISELVFHASKIDISASTTQQTGTSTLNTINAQQLTTNKRMQKILESTSSISSATTAAAAAASSTMSDTDLSTMDTLQYPYLLPFFPPTSQLKSPPLDIRQRYFYRFFDGILFGLYTSQSYINLLSQVYDKEQSFITQYIDIIYDPLKLNELDSNEMKSLLQEYNNVDQTYHLLLQTLSVTSIEASPASTNSSKTQTLLNATLGLSTIFGKSSTKLITTLFNFHALCYNPLYIHLIPQRTLLAENNSTILQPYQVRIVQYITKYLHLRCNLPVYIYTSSHPSTKDIISIINLNNGTRNGFSQVDMNNFITLLMHQIVTHNTTFLATNSTTEPTLQIPTQPSPSSPNSPQISSQVANLSTILSQSSLIDQNFRNALLTCVKHLIYSQILEVLYIDYFASPNQTLWSFAFLSNPLIQTTLDAISSQLNTDINKYDLHLPLFSPLNLSSPPQGFSINSIPLQLNHKSNPNQVALFPTQSLFTKLFALNCTTLLTFVFEHLISGCYHNTSFISNHYRTCSTQFLTQIVSATNSTNISFNIPTVCESWEVDYVSHLLQPQSPQPPQSQPRQYSQRALQPIPTQPMSPTHYLYTLYLLSQFWAFESLLSTINPSPLPNDSTNPTKFSPLIPSLHPYPTLLQSPPTTYHEFTSPRDTLTFHPLPVNPYLATTTTSHRTQTPQTSFAATIFTASFHLLLELFHITTVDFHKLILFEWFGIYSSLIQTHLYFKLLDDVKLSNISLSEDQIHQFFQVTSASPQLILQSQLSHHQQQQQQQPISFVLPVGAMIDFTQHKDQTLTAIIISYNHLISLKSISHINLFISNLYLTPARAFCLIPVPVLAQLLSTPLLFEFFDTLPQKLLRYALLHRRPANVHNDTNELFNDDELTQLYNNFTAINSPYLIGHLTNHFIPHEFTAAHPLFPTEPQLLVQEQKSTISQFLSFISTQTPQSLPTDNIATPLMMDRISTTNQLYYSQHCATPVSQQQQPPPSSFDPNATFSSDFTLPQYEHKWSQFSHGLLLSVNATPTIQ